MNGSYGNWPLSKYNSPGIYNPATQDWRPWWANTRGVNQIIVGTDAAPFFQGLTPRPQTTGDWGAAPADVGTFHTGKGGYSYYQFENGDVAIVGGPPGTTKVILPAFSGRQWETITKEIGPAPVHAHVKSLQKRGFLSIFGDYGDDDYGLMPYGDGGVIDTIKGFLSKLISFYKTPVGLMVGIAIGLLILTQTKVGKKIKSTALRIIKNPAQTLMSFGQKAPAKAKRAKAKRKATRKAAYTGSGSQREPRHGKHSWHKGEYGRYYGKGKGARFRNSQYKARHVGRHVPMTRARAQHNKRKR
jgi:hypothetical protein